MNSIEDSIDERGFLIVREVLTAESLAEVCASLSRALADSDQVDGPIRREQRSVVASRNLLQVWPEVTTQCKCERIRLPLLSLLGDRCGLVRALYFDKPPGQSWSLPWHKDMTIAVRRHILPTSNAVKATTKAGVPHIEAPRSVLEQMLTVRLHLDDVDHENGPLLVMPGSHRDGNDSLPTVNAQDAVPILLKAGDALLMRPLLSHCSQSAEHNTERHRRTIHLEFAATPQLPDDYEWHDFRPIGTLCE